MKKKICAVCGREFVGFASRLYCSTRCKDKHDIGVYKQKNKAFNKQ